MSEPVSPCPILPSGATFLPQDAHFNITELSITGDALSYEMSTTAQNGAEKIESAVPHSLIP